MVLGAISLMSEVPGAAPPEATALDVPAGSEFNQQREDEEATLSPLQDTQLPDSVPQVTAPAPDDLSSLKDADTTPARTPETGQAEAALDAPAAPTGGADVAVGTEDPVLPNPQALAPEAPGGEEDLSISTDPAQPVLPEAEDSAFPDPAPSQADTAPTAPTATEQPAEAPAPAPASEPVPEAQATALPDPAPATPAEETPQDSAPAAGTIGDLAQGVTTNRLPSVGDPAPEPETATPEPEDEAVAEDEPQRAIDRFAVPFENPEGKPLMSIVLIDDGTSPIGPAALADFPYPISFAIDATRPDAARIAGQYREAGLEVLAMANLPETATARDAEVTMATYLDAVPEAVAVMEGTGSGLQASREAAEQLAPILLDSGHGLVLFPNGLNTVQKLIAREGVPAAPVFRDFDGAGQNATVIRRFLDQAAFRAGQETGGVIMLGRLRPDTISALLLWGLQDRAASVALAPVSAVLSAE